MSQEKRTIIEPEPPYNDHIMTILEGVGKPRINLFATLYLWKVRMFKSTPCRWIVSKRDGSIVFSSADRETAIQNMKRTTTWEPVPE